MGVIVEPTPRRGWTPPRTQPASGQASWSPRVPGSGHTRARYRNSVGPTVKGCDLPLRPSPPWEASGGLRIRSRFYLYGNRLHLAQHHHLLQQHGDLTPRMVRDGEGNVCEAPIHTPGARRVCDSHHPEGQPCVPAGEPLFPGAPGSSDCPPHCLPLQATSPQGGNQPPTVSLTCIRIPFCRFVAACLG